MESRKSLVEGKEEESPVRIVKLWDLLDVSKHRYVIPSYQRGYSWGDDQIKDLWDDIQHAEGKSYFLGQISVKPFGKASPRFFRELYTIYHVVFLSCHDLLNLNLSFSSCFVGVSSVPFSSFPLFCASILLTLLLKSSVV